MNDLAPVLTGTRILVTAQRRSTELAGALERRGAAVHVVPTLGVVDHIDEQRLLENTRTVIAADLDAVVVTTAIGLRGWLEAAAAVGLDEELLIRLGKTRLIARGPKALGALQAAGLSADWVADSETSAEILALLLEEGVSGDRIAIQYHGAGDPDMTDPLLAAGAEVIPLEVYRWGPPPDPAAVADAVLEVAAGAYDAVVFTSAPAAVAFLDEVDRQGVTDVVRDLVLDSRLLMAAVGPVTAEPLVTAQMLPRQPDRARMGALVRMIIVSLGEGFEGLSTADGVLRIRASAATLDHRELPLSPSGLAVLRRLAREPGRVVSREHLLSALPGDSADPHAAEVAVGRLREALAPHQLVRTVVKRGYALQVH